MSAGFFGRLFGGTKDDVKIDLQVFMYRNYLDHIIVNTVRTGGTVIISFFESTHAQLMQLAGEAFSEKFFLYSALHNSAALSKMQALAGSGHHVALSERYPVASREAELVTHLKQWGITTNVSSYCALDDQIMKAFGGDKIITLMKRMGMSENESIHHDMVSSSLVKAQNKIAKKVMYEQQAKSPEEWFRLNAPLANA